VAATGAAGLDRVRADPPDVILLDMRLPDQSGLEVYQAVRAIDARIPVIFATMAKTADTAIEAMKRGAFDYLFKPLDLAQVRRVVGEAVEVGRRMRAPAVVVTDGAAPDPERRRRDPRRVPGDARGVQGDRPRRRPGRGRPDRRRDRHGQGTDRAGHLPARRPRPRAVHGPELRGDPGKPAGE